MLKNKLIINGKKAVYWEKNTKKVKIIILLHGFPGNHMGLIEFARGIGDDYRIIMPDLPGSGMSEKLDKRNILKNYADWLNDFIGKLSIKDKVIIIGHSFGSRVAIVFSYYYQNKINRLILINPAVKADNFIDRITFVEYKIAKLLPPNFAHILLSNKIYQRLVHAIISGYIKSKRRRKQVTDRDFREYKRVDPNTILDLSDEFYKTNLALLGKKIDVSSLVIAGDKDIVANLKEINELVGYMKNAELKIMENTGHLAPVEKPFAVSGIIKNWLKKDNNIKNT